MNACAICKCLRVPCSRLIWGENEYILSYTNYRANLHVPFEILGRNTDEDAISNFWEAILHAYFCIIRGRRLVQVNETYLT